MPFRKGQSGNPTGRSRVDPILKFKLRMAARSYAPEALETIVECMRCDDPRVRLVAASVILDRGYGKPKEHIDAETVHSFAEVPQVMNQADWLRTKGQPELLLPPPDDPDRKLN